jgi:hypothetical protein
VVWAERAAILGKGSLAVIADSHTDKISVVGAEAAGGIRVLPGRCQSVLKSLTLSADGSIMAAVEDNRWCLWDVRARRLRRTVPATALLSIGTGALSPDGRCLALGCDNANLDKDARHIVQLWDAWDRRRAPDMQGHEGAITCLAFAPDSSLVASGGSDGIVIVWDALTGQTIYTLGAQLGPITAVRFSPDGRFLASAAGDGSAPAGDPPSVWLWDLHGGTKALAFTHHEGHCDALAFSPDGALLASGTGACTTLVWDVRGARKPAAAPAPLSAKQRAGLWEDLGARRGGDAYEALLALAAQGDCILPFLREKLATPRAPTQAQVENWVRDLESNHFRTREAAFKQLRRYSTVAEAALRALLRGDLPPQARRDLTRLLESPWYARPGDGADVLRRVRAVQILARIGTPHAKDLLSKLATDTAAWRQSQAAIEAIGNGTQR